MNANILIRTSDGEETILTQEEIDKRNEVASISDYFASLIGEYVPKLFDELENYGEWVSDGFGYDLHVGGYILNEYGNELVGVIDSKGNRLLATHDPALRMYAAEKILEEVKGNDA